MAASTSLTQMQLLGVGSDTNVAEGHPRQALTPSQAAIVARLPALMDEALRTPFHVLEARAHSAFFGALGQRAAPVGTGRILSFYSSTVAIDVVGGCLAQATSRAAVVHPTIDCIPELLAYRGLELVPIGEGRLGGTDPLRGLDVGVVFCATPNNPTGTVLGAKALRRLAEACAERDATLVLDSCFRAFDPRAQYDTYELLDATGVEYVVVEDTGKLWPMAGLKLGFAVSSERSRLPIAKAASDVLLTAPPLTAALVAELSEDMGNGGLVELHTLIAGNRAIVEEELEGCTTAGVADGASRVSVTRIRLQAGLSSTRLWGQLLQRGVHTVPCRPFYWARPSAGERYLRIALARDPAIVRRAARAVRETLES